MTDTTLPPNEVGMKVLGGYKFGKAEGWIAPGHNSVLKDGDDYYIVHHARSEKNPRWHFLGLKVIFESLIAENTLSKCTTCSSKVLE